MSAQVSRRAVLEAVGAMGGAGILFESMGALGLAPTAGAAQAPYRAPTPGDFSLTGRRRARVVVLGAGIAGLTAAYELGKAGYDCVVLEASSRPGGRNWTVRGGTTERDLDGHVQTARFGKGQYLNAGPARIAQWMVTMDYCRELGVAIEPLANQNASSYIYHEKGPLSGTGIRYRTAKADVYGYISELLAKATDQGALDRTLTAADKERLLDLLQDFGDISGRSGGWRYEGSSRRGYRVNPGAGSQKGVVSGPPPSLHEILGSEIGLDFSFEFGYEQAMMMFQPVGGMDHIAYALARKVGAGRLRYRSQVLSFADRPDGVEVDYRDEHGRIHRRACRLLCRRDAAAPAGTPAPQPGDTGAARADQAAPAGRGQDGSGVRTAVVGGGRAHLRGHHHHGPGRRARSGTRPTDSSGNGACCSATTTGAPTPGCTTR